MGIFNLSQVGITGIDKTSPATIEVALEQVLSYLGGLDRYVQPGLRVLLKPDLMIDYPGTSGGTTDSEVVAAMARLLMRCGAEVVVGDSPFVPLSGIDEFWRRTGLASVAARDGFELVSFEMAGSEAIAVDTRVYYISRAVLGADVIINMPTLKPDSWTGFAGAIRNTVGAVPGFQKGRYFARASSARDLAGFLVDILSLVRPELSIIDMPSGTMAERGGPDSPGFIAASSDAVALDTVIAEILGLEHHNVHTTRLAAEAGMGFGWPEAVRIRGECLEALIPFFNTVGGRRSLRFLRNLKRGITEPFVWMRSSVNRHLCDGCGACVSSCPTKALHFPDGSREPTINYDLCINCWAGLSNCPVQAIQVEPSPRARKMFRQAQALDQIA